MTIQFTIGHLRGGEETLELPADQVPKSLLALIRELTQSDDEHYQVYVGNKQHESITIYDGGLFVYSKSTDVDAPQLYYKPVDLDDALAVLLSFVREEPGYQNRFAPSRPTGTTSFCPRIADNPLHSAANRGNLHFVKRLVESGWNVNARDGDGATPLMHAALEGHYDVCKYLIENGADVSLRDNDGEGLSSLASEYPDILALLTK